MDENDLILPEDELFFDEDDLNLGEILASHLMPSDPEAASFPPYMGEGDCLLQPTTLGGDSEPEEAAAAPFPLFIGALSAQPPTPGGSVEAASPFPQFIGEFSGQAPTPGGSVEAASPFPQFIGEFSGQAPTPGGSVEAASPFPQFIGEFSGQAPTLGGSTEAASPFPLPQFIGDFSAQPPTLGGSMEAASAFPYHNGSDEGSGLPPAMSSMEEAAHLAPSNAPLYPLDDVFDEVSSPEETELLFEFAAELANGNDQWRLGAAHPQGFMMPWTNQFDANANRTPWLSQFDADSLLGTTQATIDNSAAATHQVRQEIPYSNTPALDYPQPPPPATAAAEAMEMAELSRVASECGGEASMVWSPDEDKLLLDGLSRLANQDSVSMCIEIAYGLPKKTAMDVAMRIRWFQSKNKSAAQAGVISKESAGGKTEKAQAQAGVRSKESAVRKTRKGKGIENPNMKRNKHAPSERAQDCRSTKALIRDNSMLLDHIDDKLRTGQLACAPSMFDKVKTNVDAILAKMRAMGVNTDEYKIDLEALEEIKRGFHPSSDK